MIFEKAKSKIKRFIKKLLIFGLNIILTRPALKRFLIYFLAKFPRLHALVANSFLRFLPESPSASNSGIAPASISTISSRANQIHSDLMEATAKNKGNQ